MPISVLKKLTINLFIEKCTYIKGDIQVYIWNNVYVNWAFILFLGQIEDFIPQNCYDNVDNIFPFKKTNTVQKIFLVSQEHSPCLVFLTVIA